MFSHSCYLHLELRAFLLHHVSPTFHHIYILSYKFFYSNECLSFLYLYPLCIVFTSKDWNIWIYCPYICDISNIYGYWYKIQEDISINRYFRIFYQYFIDFSIFFCVSTDISSIFLNILLIFNWFFDFFYH